MALRKATSFEMLRALHTLWYHDHIDSSQVVKTLKIEYGLTLKSITKDGIEVISNDNLSNYKITK